MWTVRMWISYSRAACHRYLTASRKPGKSRLAISGLRKSNPDLPNVPAGAYTVATSKLLSPFAAMRATSAGKSLRFTAVPSTMTLRPQRLGDVADAVQTFDVPAIVVPGESRPRAVVDAIADGVRPMNHSQECLDDPPVSEHEQVRLDG